MEIRKRFSGNIVILYITGKITIDSAAIIETTGTLLKEGMQKILCNFANVETVDYNGLSILAIAYKNVTNKKGALKFCEVPAHVKGLFKAARLDIVFEIHAKEEDAVKSFALSSKVDILKLRRRFKRIDANIPVRYKVGLSTSTQFVRGKILNLSGEGAFIRSKNMFPCLTQLYMEIDLRPAKARLPIMGAIVWLADKELQPHAYPGMGIKFTNVDKRTQAEIIDYIDKHLIRRSKI